MLGKAPAAMKPCSAAWLAAAAVFGDQEESQRTANTAQNTT